LHAAFDAVVVVVVVVVVANVDFLNEFDAVVVVVVVVMNGYVECCWEEWTTLCHIDCFQA
jgi:hypothetical protein